MEPALWQSKELPVNPKHVLLVTELAPFSMSPLLPTSSLSSDSGVEGYRSTSPNSVHTFSPDHHPAPVTPCSPPPMQPPFALNHLLVTSGPGFSMGITPVSNNDETGGTSYEHLSVPILQEDTTSEEVISQSLELATIFAMSEILCVNMPGENQLWVGTDKGTLHSFELTHQLIPEFDATSTSTSTITNKKSFKLTNHYWLALNEPLVSIAARPNEYVFANGSPSSSLTEEPPLKSEVLVGVPYGYIVILQGEVSQSGRMKDPLEKMSRRIVRLTNSPTDCNVKCITHVPRDDKVETYWCSCGGEVVILRSSDWRKLSSFNAREYLNSASGKVRSSHEVVQLLNCDMGVWTAVGHNSTVVLWDKNNYTPKLSLSYCDPHRSRQQRSHISIIHYMQPYLLIGTQRGDIMIFKINKNSTSSANNTSSPQKQESPLKEQLSYTYITSTNIGPRPILNIYTTPTEIRPHIPLSSPSPGDSINSIDSIMSGSHAHSSLYILLIAGVDPVTSKSDILLYELTLPSSSSTSCISSPTLSLGSNSTMGSSIRGTTPLSVPPTTGSLTLTWTPGGDFTPLGKQTAKKRRGSSFI